jgi:hypothetical protein
MTCLIEVLCKANDLSAYSKMRMAQKLGHGGALLASFLSYVVRVFGYTLLTPSTVYYIFALGESPQKASSTRKSQTNVHLHHVRIYCDENG